MPQSDGGYLGPDIRTLVSAVFSGAPGVFIATLDRGGGVLTCAVFDTSGAGDFVTLPGGEQLGGSDCPVGAGLAAGDALSWTSSGSGQGGANGCAAKGTCGLPYSRDGLGGGWQLCFA
eukprot:COSAG04_NODE_10732_length_756_cov_5.818874_1_plen_118_part_00